MILITLAGPLAQRRFAPKSNWLAGSDFNPLLNAILGERSNGTPKQKEKYLAYIGKRAKQGVDYFWLDIKAVAQALVKHETLTGDEMLTVIRAARQKTRRRQRMADPPTFALD